MDGVIDDLAAEQESLESVLTGLTDAQWSAPSAAAGWSVTDVVLHLAQTEEAVVAAVNSAGTPDMWRRGASSVDDAAEAAVQAERASPPAAARAAPDVNGRGRFNWATAC